MPGSLACSSIQMTFSTGISFVQAAWVYRRFGGYLKAAHPHIATSPTASAITVSPRIALGSIKLFEIITLRHLSEAMHYQSTAWSVTSRFVGLCRFRRNRVGSRLRLLGRSADFGSHVARPGDLRRHQTPETKFRRRMLIVTGHPEDLGQRILAMEIEQELSAFSSCLLHGGRSQSFPAPDEPIYSALRRRSRPVAQPRRRYRIVEDVAKVPHGAT